MEGAWFCMSKRSMLAIGFAGFALLALSALAGALVPGWSGLTGWVALLGTALCSICFYSYGAAPRTNADGPLRAACWACVVLPLVAPALWALGLTQGVFATLRAIAAILGALAIAWFFFILYNHWTGKVRQWALAACAAALAMLLFGPALQVAFLGDVCTIACYACATMALFCQHAVVR